MRAGREDRRISLPTGTVPIIYLPGVSRATLRATEDCPHELKPLAELQYRGVIWSQANGKDWTVAAYLQTEKGGLQPDGRQGSGHGDLAAPGRRKAGRCPARRPASQVRRRGTERQLSSTRWSATTWSTTCSPGCRDPKETRNRWEPGRWETLCSRCIADYGFDPARDGELVGAEKLGMQAKTVWKTAWKRFAAVARPVIPACLNLLRKAKPKPKPGDLLGNGSRRSTGPRTTRPRKPTCGRNCSRFATEPVAKARQTLIGLEQKHGMPTGLGLGQAEPVPAGSAIQHLATLAERDDSPADRGQRWPTWSRRTRKEAGRPMPPCWMPSPP